MSVDTLAGFKLTLSTLVVAVGSGFGTMFDWIRDGGLTAILAAILTAVVIIANVIKIKREGRQAEIELKQAELHLTIMLAKEKTRMEDVHFRRHSDQKTEDAP